jgi:simple sugar transport system permease protein
MSLNSSSESFVDQIPIKIANPDKWTTRVLILAALVSLVVPVSLLMFLADESVVVTTALWVLTAVVILGTAGVMGGAVRRVRQAPNSIELAFVGCILAFIMTVVVAIVTRDANFQAGWWAAFYAAILVEALVIVALIVHSAEAPHHRLIRFARKNALQLGIVVVFEAMWIIYIVAAPRTFLAPEIYAAFMSTIPFFGIIALPLTMVIIAGEIDLSFPSIMAIGTVAFLQVFNLTHNVWLALIACLLMGFLAGLLNGLLVVKIGIPSLIATIGTQFFWRGVVLVVQQGKSAVLVDPKNSILGELLVGKVGGYLPAQMIWLVIIAFAMWVLLNRHKFGAHIYLIGDNVNSARLMGVNVDRTRILVFALVGTVAAFAGITASLHVVNFFTSQGEGYLMTTLASVFLGGTSVFGGTGTIMGTFIACFIIGSIEAGIVAIGLTGFWTKLIYGLTIVISVSMHAVLRRRME